MWNYFFPKILSPFFLAKAPAASKLSCKPSLFLLSTAHSWHLLIRRNSPFSTSTAIGSIMPLHNSPRFPLLVSVCLLHKHCGQWLANLSPTTSKPQCSQVKSSRIRWKRFFSSIYPNVGVQGFEPWVFWSQIRNVSRYTTLRLRSQKRATADTVRKVDREGEIKLSYHILSKNDILHKIYFSTSRFHI